MADNLDPQETVSLEELVMSNVITLEAIVNLLDKHGLIGKNDLLNEIVRIKAINKSL